jgi:hypothetical protein
MTKIAGPKSESGSIGQKHGSVDSDPHQNVMDPRTLVRTGQVLVFNFLPVVSQVEKMSLKAESEEARGRAESQAAARAALHQDLLHSQAVMRSHSAQYPDRPLFRPSTQFPDIQYS